MRRAWLWCLAVQAIDDALIVRHPTVAETPRDFDMCLQEIHVKDKARTVRFRGNETSLTCAARTVALGGGDAGHTQTIEHIARFLEHRASMALMERREFRRALRWATRGGAPAVLLSSQECPEGPVDVDLAAILDRFDPWLVLDLNHFNADSETDWAFYLGDRSLAAFAMACRATAPLGDGALRDTLAYAFAALLPGASVELVVDAARSAAMDRLLLSAGFVFDQPHDAGDRGPLPSILELPVAPGELQREMACRNGAESVLIKAWRPIDFIADARRVNARPLRHVDGVHVLNLKRREDRWDAVRAKCDRAGFAEKGPRRINAVDGATLDVASEDVKRVFNLTNWRYGGAKNCHQDHGYRSRVIGCAMSHIKAWRLIAEDPDRHSMHLILEDDVEFAVDFEARWAVLGARLKADYSWDLVHLGVLDDRNLYDDYPVEGMNGVRRFSAAQRSFGAGAFAYLIRPRTAKWLLTKAYELGIQQAVDWWLVERFGDFVAYKAAPPLCASPQGEGRDSDNDEDYDQDRLVLDTYLDDEKNSTLDSLRITAPDPGSRVGVNKTLEVRVEMLVHGDPRAFFLARQLMRLCYDVHRLSHYDDPQRVFGPLCLGLAKAKEYHVPAATFTVPSWYALNATLVDEFGEKIEGATVVFEARDLRDLVDVPETYELPPALTPDAAARLVPIEVSLNGAFTKLDCARHPDLFDCVRDFCVGNEIDPAVQCMASLISSFQAQVL